MMSSNRSQASLGIIEWLRNGAAEAVEGIPEDQEWAARMREAADEIEMWRKRDMKHKQVAEALGLMEKIHHGK